MRSTSRINGRMVTKEHRDRRLPQILSPRRSRSLAEFLLHPEEPRLPEGDIAWLEVDYPKSEASIPWLVWFVVVSSAVGSHLGTVEDVKLKIDR